MVFRLFLLLPGLELGCKAQDLEGKLSYCSNVLLRSLKKRMKLLMMTFNTE